MSLLISVNYYIVIWYWRVFYFSPFVDAWFSPQPIRAGVGVHSTPPITATDACTYYHRASAASSLYVVFSLPFLLQFQW